MLAIAMTESKLGRSVVWLTATTFLVAGMWLSPVVMPQWRQDRCTFGSLTNGDYRQLLTRARAVIASDRDVWQSSIAGRRSDRATRVLQRQFQTLSAGMVSIDQRVAAMHALARAHGAEFRRTEPDNVAPWGLGPDTAPDTVRFAYRLALERVGAFRLRRWVRIDGTFAIRDVQPGFERSRGTTGNTLAMMITGTGATPRLRSVTRSAFHDCPPTPDVAWQSLYVQPPAESSLFLDKQPVPERKAYLNLLTIADNFIARDRQRLAIPHLERALLLAEAGYGANHESIAIILDRLAATYRTVGQPLKAAEYAGRSTDIRIRAGQAAPQ